MIRTLCKLARLLLYVLAGLVVLTLWIISSLPE